MGEDNKPDGQLPKTVVRAVAMVLMLASAGQRVRWGDVDLVQAARDFLDRYVERVGFDAAATEFRKHGITLVTSENNG